MACVIDPALGRAVECHVADGAFAGYTLYMDGRGNGGGQRGFGHTHESQLLNENQ